MNENNFTFPNDLPTLHELTEQELNELHNEAVKQKPSLDKAFGIDDNTSIDEETGEVTTITTSKPAPTIKENPNGGYKAFYLAPCNMNERITNALNEMIADGDTELQQAMQGKKTIDGCIRYLNNTLADLGRELKAKGLTAYDDNDIHFVARYYFVNPDCKDVQNVANAVAKEKKKKEAKPKAEKKTKSIPLTPQIGSLFGDEDFE